MKTAVVYQSHYGTTKRYAEWIAEELGAELLERRKVSPADLLRYDGVIYGGGLYASGILGVKLVAENPVKRLIVFTVGLADPRTTDYGGITAKNLSDEARSRAKIFHLRGGIDYKKLSLIHRGAMAMMKKMRVDNKTEDELSEEDRAFRDTYGKYVDFTDRETILPIVREVRDNWTD